MIRRGKSLSRLSVFVIIFLTTFIIHSAHTELSMDTKADDLPYNLVFRNCTLIDGTGSPLTVGDLAVTGSLITAMGSINDSLVTSETIVVEGDLNYLTPGFIDSHTHDDVAVLASPLHTSKTLQGVTTVVTGNCGFSSYPNGDSNPLIGQHLSSLLGDISGDHLFQNFSSYASKLTINSMGLNVASLVGHGPLRLSIVGNENRPANDSEVTAMCDLLDLQLSQGSIGLSLGLVYPPSAYAGMDELISLARVVHRHNKVVTAHVRSYEGGLLSSVSEFLDILRQSGAKGLLSHLQVAGRPYWGTMMDEAIDLIESARTVENIDVNVDMYPYLAGSSTILQLLPPSSQDGGFEAFLAKLEDVDYVENLKNMTEFGSEPGWESKIALIGWENVTIGSVVREDLKFLEGLAMTEASDLLKIPEFQVLLYLIVEDYGQTNVIMHQQSQSDQNKVFQFYAQMVGSDSIPREGGKPHPRGFGSFPRVIGRMVREQGILTVEEAVRKATGLTASRFAIGDRGLLKIGLKADLVLFNEELLDLNSFEEPTLAPQGIVGVWVNGVRVVEDGEGILTLPGEIVYASDGGRKREEL